MPYITQNQRNKLQFDLQTLINVIEDEWSAADPGILNYVITKLCQACTGDGRYTDYNRIIGVLECAKLELYRRAVSVYEDEKMRSNGDVY